MSSQHERMHAATAGQPGTNAPLATGSEHGQQLLRVFVVGCHKKRVYSRSTATCVWVTFATCRSAAHSSIRWCCDVLPRLVSPIPPHHSQHHRTMRFADVIVPERFRANFVVGGPLAPFAEDRWRELRVGPFHFKVPRLVPMAGLVVSLV